MADSVRVQFSASIGALIKGVDEAKAAILSVKEATDAVTSGAEHLLETFGLAFSTDRIAQFVDQMAGMGEQVERSAAMLGVSTKSVQELGFIAKVTGGDADGLALAMERLQVNLQKAQSGTGPAAEALKALGLNARTLAQLPLDQQLNRIADAVSKFADGGNKTAIVMELMGRSGAQMIPVLDQGHAGLDKLGQAGEDAGVVLTKQTITALSETDRALTTAKASITALGGAIVGAFSKSIIKAATELTTFTGDLSAMVQTNHLAEAAMDTLTAGVKEAAANFASLAIVAADVFSLQWTHVAADWKAGNDQILAIQQESDARLKALATQSKVELQAILGSENKRSGLPQAPPTGGPDKSELSAQMEKYQNQIKIADAVYKETQEKLEAEVKLHEISYGEETRLLLAALDTRHEAELAALAAELEVGGLSVAQYQKIMDERIEVDQKYKADHEKIVDEAAEKDAQIWKSLADQISGAFNSQLLKILQGHETFAQAMKKISADLALKFIEDQARFTLEFTLNQARILATAVLTQSGITSATTAGVAIRDAANAASGQAGIMEMIANAMKAVMAGAGATAAGAAGWAAPAIGPAAVPVGLAAGAAVAAAAGGMVSQDLGSWDVPGIVPALLHPHEMVVPQTFASGLRGMMSGTGDTPGSRSGDQHIHFNISTPNTRDMARALSDNDSAVMKAVQKAVKRGAHLRR